MHDDSCLDESDIVSEERFRRCRDRQLQRDCHHQLLAHRRQQVYTHHVEGGGRLRLQESTDGEELPIQHRPLSAQDLQYRLAACRLRPEARAGDHRQEHLQRRHLLQERGGRHTENILQHRLRRPVAGQGGTGVQQQQGAPSQLYRSGQREEGHNYRHLQLAANGQQRTGRACRHP